MDGCLIIHGFTGSPYEIEPLANHLRASTDWKVETPTLPGHGKEDTLHRVTYGEWIKASEEALRTLKEQCDSVYLIGFSMGGVISGYLAQKYEVKRLVLLSAAAYYISPKQTMKDSLEMMRDFFRGRIRENEMFKRRKPVRTPLSASWQFTRLVKELRPLFANITVPTLIIQGKIDRVVPFRSAEFIYRTIASEEKYLHYLERSRHILCRGEEAIDVVQLVSNFLGVRV
ncbi:alpha/beta hydrolase [Pseudalkalibacillus caeni]|uniref:Alpha/beta fold hydrolase n=1 Tax=Exobacillus caeni TaxID=2574798 RepID=A0A5R9EUR0_9BACL|nr:alpha/beta fold hydrolase [Pseudalkalibacillus caeni]TLS34932.1 alpha/beta fold hydrolase [Pseudalkalibacillus caeni]